MFLPTKFVNDELHVREREICKYTYANIFMAELEQKYIYPLIKDNSFLMLYRWYLYGMDQIWKTGKRFYEWTESKTYLYNVWLQIWLQANKVPRRFSLYIDQQNKLQTTQTTNLQTFLMRNRTSVLIKEKYSLQPSTSNSTNMLNITRIPQSL